MKIKYLLIILLIACVGCNNNKKDELVYEQITSYYKIIDSTTVEIMAIYENVSDVDGIIKYIGYGANDANGESLGFDGKDVNIEFKSHKQILIRETLKIKEGKIDYIYLTPFYEKEKFIKTQESNGIIGDNHKELAKYIDTLESKIENNTTNYKINLKLNENISFNQIKTILYDKENFPICVVYYDEKNSMNKDEISSYEFKCEGKIEEIGNIKIYYE